MRVFQSDEVDERCMLKISKSSSVKLHALQLWNDLNDIWGSIAVSYFLLIIILNKRVSL